MIKPILLSTEMVEAILEGIKTQTRRVIKKKYINTDFQLRGNTLVEIQNDVPVARKNEDGTTTRHFRHYEERSPQYQIGDILWVRETWAKFGKGYIYKADGFQEYDDIKVKWKPSIHMPKKAARIFLEVTNVRAEQLQHISERDAFAEGVIKGHSPVPKGVKWSDTVGKASLKSFKALWIHLYGEQSWNDNPFVWVYEFKRIEKNKII